MTKVSNRSAKTGFLDMYAPAIVSAKVWNNEANMKAYCGTDNPKEFGKHVSITLSIGTARSRKNKVGTSGELIVIIQLLQGSHPTPQTYIRQITCGQLKMKGNMW
jgi:hypothetical protein